MCSNNATEKCGIGICTCTVKPKFEVGQIWETNSPRAKYLRIICTDCKGPQPVIGLWSNDLKRESVVSVWDDGSFDASGLDYPIAVKLYVPKKTMKKTIYWWHHSRTNSFLTVVDYTEYEGYTLMAKRDIELAEGEGL